MDTGDGFPSSALLHSFSILILVSVAYFFLPRLPNNLSKNIPPRPLTAPLCESPECVHAASEILYNLDPRYPEIDPCTNFDHYACGGWTERHDMRPDQGAIFVETLMSEVMQTQLRYILESTKAPEAADKENLNKLKAAYSAYLDESAIRKRGSEPLDNILAGLEKIYTGASISAGSDVNLTDAVLFLYGFEVPALVYVGVGVDDRDPDSTTISLSPPYDIGLPVREYYNNSDTVAEYAKVVKHVLGSFLGGQARVPFEDLVIFESKLAKVIPDAQTLEDITKSYNPRTIKETESLLPQILLSNIILALAPPDYKTNRVIVSSPSYMESLSSILSETPREIIELFFKWKIIQRYASKIEHPKITPLREFYNKLVGRDPKATEERWRRCIKSLDYGLPWNLGRFYILDTFSRGSKELGDQIVSDIKEHFVYTLHQAGWISPEARQLAVQKVGNIAQKIGYPTQSPNVMDPVDVEKYYQDLKISNESFFENNVTITKFDIRNSWSKLGKPWDRNKWMMSPQTANAYYDAPGNQIALPAGIMQPPTFYGLSAPLYLTYGAFSTIAGHELTHAFDTTGRHYDQNGNYTNWWDENTVKGFEERAQCFVDQYSKFTVPGDNDELLHVNGLLTLGENIADAGEVGAAFLAWKKRDEESPDPHLPGLSQFSKEQLFFVSYANLWCSKTTKRAAIWGIYNDDHAPAPARIIGTMANSREFREAFNCPTKEPVCKLWSLV